MAKAKTGGTRSYLRGRVGSDVYSIGKTAKGSKQQVVRSLAEVVSNPQTTAQMRGRMIMSTVMQAVSAMSPIVDHSFDNVPAGQPNISEFIRLNYALVKADVAANPASGNQFGLNKYGEKGIKQGAYVVAAGSAADVAGVQIDTTAKTLTIALSAGATIANLRTALGLSTEDYFTVVCITADSKFLYERFHVTTALPSATIISAENLASIISLDGNVGVQLALTGNNIVATFAELTANNGIIVSRKENATYKHNDVVLVAPTAPEYTSNDALPTYPTGTQRFLNGGGEEVTPFSPTPVVDPIEITNYKFNNKDFEYGRYVYGNSQGSSGPLTFTAVNVAANGGANIKRTTNATYSDSATQVAEVTDGANTINISTLSTNNSIWLVPVNGTPEKIFSYYPDGD